MGDRKTSYFVILATTLALAGFSSGIAMEAFAEIDCDENYEYRSFDGTCNNLDNPDWGSVGVEQLRVSGNDYDEDSSLVGETRNNPRFISNVVSNQTEDVFNEQNASDFIWQWGQFLDHDITLTPTDPSDPAPIIVDFDDPIFDMILFSRSIHNGENPREQINAITSYIDASNVYGSDNATAALLRDGDSIYMKTSEDNLLPKDPHGFFMAGDVRANEGIRLIAMHTLFVLEHNRIAEQIQNENPDWSDEQVFQAARKIVGAKMQAITFNEFLPKLLGPDAIPEYSGYDSTKNPGIANEFSTASFRYGHSQASSTILVIDGRQTSNVSLAEQFFNPELFEEIGMEPIIQGLMYQKAQKIDTLVVDELRNFLFANVEGVGFDLASLNIQRGRDHGLPDYNTMRDSYGLPKVTSFSQISSDPQVQTKLSTAYSSVNDIDPWVGGIAEDHYPNAMVGETVREVLIDQFSRIRDGDRFWYQNDQFFTDNPNWKNEVENSSLRKVIYDNTGMSMPLNVFSFTEFGSSSSGSGGDGHLTRPTFGPSHETHEIIVDAGFKFNDQSFTIDENHHTLFAQQDVNIGEVNSFEATLYADKGLKVQEFLFGIPNVGDGHLAELGIEIWYDSNGQIQDVKIVQNSNVIDPNSLMVSHEKSKCTPSALEARCDTTKVSMTFLEHLKDNVMAIKAIDQKNRFQITYLNDGIDIKGESLNQMNTMMIPSNMKNQGIIQVTQLAKYSPYWQSEDGRMFEMNSFGSFKEINQTFERFQDTGDAKTRLHSEFGGIINYETKRATNVFDASQFVAELPDSFAYIYPDTGERISDELRQEMLLQEEIAQLLLEEMDKQGRLH